jgi:hypothetical protein
MQENSAILPMFACLKTLKNSCVYVNINVVMQIMLITININIIAYEFIV